MHCNIMQTEIQVSFEYNGADRKKVGTLLLNLLRHMVPLTSSKSSYCTNLYLDPYGLVTFLEGF